MWFTSGPVRTWDSERRTSPNETAALPVHFSEIAFQDGACLRHQPLRERQGGAAISERSATWLRGRASCRERQAGEEGEG